MGEVMQAIVLGLVQGVTEFVPVSSSGHLILVRDLLSIQPDSALAFDAVLHLATALAAVVYFRKEIANIGLSLIRRVFRSFGNLDAEGSKQLTLAWALLLGTIPAVLLGIFFESFIETYLRSSYVVSLSLIGGSLLFILAEKLATQSKEVSRKSGLIVGFFQALALIPGISRAGASISGGLLFGFTREYAAKFAFLLGIPILLGVGIVKLVELSSVGFAGGLGLSLLVSSAVAFAVGFLSIHFMMQFLKNHTLYVFALYRILLAFLVLAIF